MQGIDPGVTFNAIRAIIRSLDLPRAQRAILLEIALRVSHTNPKDLRAHIEANDLAKATDYSRSHTLAAVRELENAGLIARTRVTRRCNHGHISGAPSKYHLTLPKA